MERVVSLGAACYPAGVRPTGRQEGILYWARQTLAGKQLLVQLAD